MSHQSCISTALTHCSGSIASAARFKYIPQLAQEFRLFYRKEMGITAASLVEIAAGIVAGSLATLRPLLRRWIRGAKTSFRGPHDDYVKDSKERYKIGYPYPVSPLSDVKIKADLQNPDPIYAKYHDDRRSSTSTEDFIEAESFGQISPISKPTFSDAYGQTLKSPLSHKIRHGILPPIPSDVAMPLVKLSRGQSYNYDRRNSSPP